MVVLPEFVGIMALDVLKVPLLMPAYRRMGSYQHPSGRRPLGGEGEVFM